MTVLRVDRVRARYRIPSGAREERRRLDGMLKRAFDAELASAPELPGLRDSELVCVRRLEVLFRADLARTESALAGGWAEAFARELARAVEGGAAEVVRYRSPSAGLVDVLRRTARNDFSRVWAWSSLGLWTGGSEPTPGDAPRAVTAVLVARPELAAPVLDAVAGEPAVDRLLFGRLDAPSWTRIALAALAAAGANPGLAEAPPDDAPARHGPADRPEAPMGGLEAGSGAGAGLVEAAGRAGIRPDVARAVAILGLLARAPWAVIGGGGGAADAVGALARRVTGSTGAEVGGASRTPAAGDGASDGRPSVRRGHAAPAVADENGGPPSDAGAASGSRPAPEGEAVAGTVEGETGRRGAGGPERAGASTAWGGLLFFLNLLDDDELRRELLHAPALRERPVRWVLHRLATTLAPAAEDDAAVLAFCGLGPDAEPPSRHRDPPTTAEEEELDEAARRLRERLHGRLGVEEGSPGEVVRRTIERRARVLADPGWIEVRMSLRDVAPEIRRAGLDLNPGHLPWLGVVVSFSYG